MEDIKSEKVDMSKQEVDTMEKNDEDLDSKIHASNVCQVEKLKSEETFEQGNIGQFGPHLGDNKMHVKQELVAINWNSFTNNQKNVAEIEDQNGDLNCQHKGQNQCHQNQMNSSRKIKWIKEEIVVILDSDEEIDKVSENSALVLFKPHFKLEVNILDEYKIVLPDQSLTESNGLEVVEFNNQKKCNDSIDQNMSELCRQEFVEFCERRLKELKKLKMVRPCSVVVVDIMSKISLKDSSLPLGYEVCSSLSEKQFQISKEGNKCNVRSKSYQDSYKSGVCDGGRSQGTDLIKHTRKHVAKKQNENNHCQNELAANENLFNERSCSSQPSYTCDVCGESFVMLNEMEVHRMTHGRNDKLFECLMCNNKYTKFSLLCKHMRTHTGEISSECFVSHKKFGINKRLEIQKGKYTGKIYVKNVCGKESTISQPMIQIKRIKQMHKVTKTCKCDFCGKAFTLHTDLKRHTMIHTGEKLYKCDVCYKAFTHNGNLKKHKKFHTGEKPYKCDVCGKAFNHKSNLNTHTRIHTGEKPYKCDVCSKAFTQNYSLKMHKKLHTGEKPYKCDVCGKTFSKKLDLKDHKFIHTGEKPYKCDVCGKIFTHNYYLKGHKLIHTEEQPYKCKVCGKLFSHNNSLKVHKKLHAGEKPYKCDVCNKIFSYDNSLKVHKRLHTEELPYKCDVCGKAYNQNHNLAIHKLIHTGEKPYKCDVCGKAFTLNHNLKEHKLIHTGKKRYKCDVCGKAFSENRYLKDHKLIHTGEQPYKCDVCGKIFSYDNSLKVHKRLHTEELPYKCDVCGKAYNQNNNLAIHKLTHTGEQPYKCDVCGKIFSYKNSLNVHKMLHTGEQTLQI